MPRGIRRRTVAGVFLLSALVLQFGCMVSGGGEKTPEDPPNEIPLLVITPMTLDFGKDKEELVFEISNGGGGELIWFVDANYSWGNASCTPYAGNVTNGAESVKVTVDRTGLKDITEGQITICSNGDNGGGCVIHVTVDVGGTATLYGVVIDDDDEAPLEGVTITAGTPPDTYTTTSGIGGSFAMAVPIGGVFPIYADKERYERCEYKGKLLYLLGPPPEYYLDNPIRMTPSE